MFWPSFLKLYICTHTFIHAHAYICVPLLPFLPMGVSIVLFQLDTPLCNPSPGPGHLRSPYLTPVFSFLGLPEQRTTHEWLKTTEIIGSQFWRLEVDIKELAGPGSLCQLSGNPSLLRPSFWWFPGSLWRSFACSYITPVSAFIVTCLLCVCLCVFM